MCTIFWKNLHGNEFPGVNEMLEISHSVGSGKWGNETHCED